MNPSSNKNIARLQKQFFWVLISAASSAVLTLFALRDGLWFSDYLAGISIIINLVLIQMSRWGLASEIKGPETMRYFRGERFSFLVLGILSFSFLLIGTLISLEKFMVAQFPVVLLVCYVVGLRIFPPLVFCTTADTLFAFNWRRLQIKRSEILAWKIVKEVLTIKYGRKYYRFSLNQKSLDSFRTWINPTHKAPVK